MVLYVKIVPFESAVASKFWQLKASQVLYERSFDISFGSCPTTFKSRGISEYPFRVSGLLYLQAFFIMTSNPRLIWAASIVLSSCLVGRATAQSQHQVPLVIENENPWGSGHNELYLPNHRSPIPGTIPFVPDELINYYEKHINDLDGGDVRRSPCPAVNVLANRGYIPRSGRDVSYEELSQAARDVYNFGDDNVSLLHSGEPNRSLAHVCIDLACTHPNTSPPFKSYAS